MTPPAPTERPVIAKVTRGMCDFPRSDLAGLPRSPRPVCGDTPGHANDPGRLVHVGVKVSGKQVKTWMCAHAHCVQTLEPVRLHCFQVLQS